MASTKSREEEPSKALKCQTWVLKVSINCQGCRRKVKKVLQAIDGVYTATVDSQQHRVTVTGNVKVEILIEKLIKRGKHAEIWPEKLTPNEKESKNGSNGKKVSVKFKEEGKCEATPENLNPGEESREKNNSGGKKKKNKAQKSDNTKSSSSGSPSAGASASTGYENQGQGIDQVMGPSNLNPTRQQQWVAFLPDYNIAPSFLYASSSYSRENLGPFFYYDPPPPPYTKRELDSFNYFSDENVNGCFIM